MNQDLKAPAAAHIDGERLTAPLGMVIRLSLGAIISVADMVTDLLTVERFFRQGQRSFAVASLCMIGITISWLLFMVYFQNKRRGGARVVQESLLLLTCLKPGVDAYRVCRGEVHTDDSFDPLLEMVFCKATEM